MIPPGLSIALPSCTASHIDLRLCEYPDDHILVMSPGWVQHVCSFEIHEPRRLAMSTGSMEKNAIGTRSMPGNFMTLYHPHLNLEVWIGLAGDAAGDDVKKEVSRVLVGRQLEAQADEVGQCGS